MRKILIAFILTASVLQAKAMSLEERILDVAERQFCIEVERLAQAVMSRRQQGTTLNEMLWIADRQKIRVSVRDIVLLAYRVPMHRSWKSKSEAISDFGARFRIQCEVER